jgi:hypothetical protein
MNFKYYFSVLTAIGCMFILSSCENKSASSSEDPVPSVRHLNCPDSVYIMAAQDTVGTPFFIDYYQYDSNGNMLCRLTYNVKIQQYTEKEERTYDARNNPLEKRYYSFDAILNEWDCWRTDRKTYDSNGKLATYETEHKDGTARKKAIYSWSDDTHADADIYAYHYMGDTTEWKLVDKAEYTYTSHGDIAYEKYIFSYYTSESACDKPIEYFFEYDQHNNATSYKLMNSGRQEEYEMYSYTYDADGNILIKYTYTNTSGEPVLKTKEVYFY